MPEAPDAESVERKLARLRQLCGTLTRAEARERMTALPRTEPLADMVARKLEELRALVELAKELQMAGEQLD